MILKKVDKRVKELKGHRSIVLLEKLEEAAMKFQRDGENKENLIQKTAIKDILLERLKK